MTRSPLSSNARPAPVDGGFNRPESRPGVSFQYDPGAIIRQDTMATIDTHEAGDLFTMVDPSDLITRPPFSDLFPIDSAIRKAVTLSMLEEGYDESKPINAWLVSDGYLVIDGHTRRLSAIDAGIADVPICPRVFQDEDEALRYAINNQRVRRTVSAADMHRIIQLVDKRRKHGGWRGNQHTGGVPDPNGSGKISVDILPEIKSADVTAEITGYGTASVNRSRVVAKDPEIEKEVLQGKRGLHSAAKLVIDKEKEEKKKKAYEAVIPAGTTDNKGSSPVFSALAYDEATAGWLASHPLRARVVSSQFDEDALIYRRFATNLGAIRGELQQLIGARTDEKAGVLYRALLRVSPLPPINTWSLCTKCKGSGRTDKRCSACRGGGYSIPGF